MNKLGKHKEALTILDNIIKNNNGKSRRVEWTYSLKAEYLMGLECYDEALEVYDKLIEEDYSLNGAVYKTECLMKLERDEEALTVWDELIEEKPEDEYLYCFKAEYLMGLERYEEAIEYCDKSISLISQENPTPYEYKAMCLKKLGKHEEAEKCYDKAIDEHSAWLSTIIHRD